jgi:hypothetical protein
MLMTPLFLFGFVIWLIGFFISILNLNYGTIWGFGYGLQVAGLAIQISSIVGWI